MEFINRNQNTLEEKTLFELMGLDRIFTHEDLHFQISYNSDGYLTLRWVSIQNPSRDFLLVLDPEETDKVLTFIRNLAIVGQRLGGDP
jgi:hypothetical protein